MISAQGHLFGRWNWLPGYGVALLAVGLMTLLIALIRAVLTIPNLAMLYLLAVLMLAIRFGRGPAIFASLLAFLSFDWFFVPPLGTFTMAEPNEWLALTLFLVIAIVTGQLAARERERAEAAALGERIALLQAAITRLFDTPDNRAMLTAVAQQVRQETAYTALELSLLREHDTPLTVVSIAPQDTGIVPDLTTLIPLAAIPILVDGRNAGSLKPLVAAGAYAAPADEQVLAALATTVGAALERALLRREATEAESLRRTDELKTALLNAVSHDLRTPLASILASAGSLRQHDITWTMEERQEFIETIEIQAQRLNRLVANLLDLSRIEGGSLHPDRAWYDLGSLIYDVLSRLQPLLMRHHLAVDLPDDLPPVYLDAVEIDQVLSNLIENAAKYAPPETKIWITVRREREEVSVQVADRGPGIPEAALPHLFTRYFRITGKGPRPPGLGLGLVVAKGLVEAHGGRIWAKNRLDSGAYFGFTLPLSPHMADATGTVGPATDQKGIGISG